VQYFLGLSILAAFGESITFLILVECSRNKNVLEEEEGKSGCDATGDADRQADSKESFLKNPD